MGDLAVDTAVSGDHGTYDARLSPDWEIWGPNGGYLAAVALRATGAHSSHPRPASLLCHFLAVASFDAVTVEVETLRRSRRTESMRVSMRQGERRVLEGLVWAVDDDLDGMDHHHAPAPDAPPPDTIVPADELRRRSGSPRPEHAFFTNLDQRPLTWTDEPDERPAGDPVHRSWYRFRPTPVFADPWVDAGRLAIMVDTFQWPAAAMGHAEADLRHVAPSLDLACRFHHLDRSAGADWLLVEARSPVAAGGLVSGTAAVWDRDGTLLASGGQQMLCRPMPAP